MPMTVTPRFKILPRDFTMEATRIKFNDQIPSEIIQEGCSVTEKFIQKLEVDLKN